MGFAAFYEDGNLVKAVAVANVTGIKSAGCYVITPSYLLSDLFRY